jgi:multidrug efflux pump
MNSLLAAAIDRSRTTLSILAMVLIAGMVARATITVETDPDITIPIVMVTIPHPGISPEDADRLIVRPVETEVRVLEGIEEVTSYAREGLASFVLEFDVDYDPDVALTEVRAAVDRAQAELPGTTEEPLIQSVTFTDFPVIVISLASDTIPERTIYRIALRLKKGLEGLSEVSEANLRGHREELLEALIDPTQLEYYQISQQELFSTVINNNRLIAAGAMDTGRGRFAVKVPGLIETREDVYNLPIKSTSDTVVTLDKIATVQRTFKDRQSYSRVNGEPAISVEVLRRPDTNIIDMNKKIRAFVEREKERFPAGLTLTYSQDQAPFAEQQVTELQGNIMTAMALVMILVVAALGLRSGLLVVASVPFSFLFALTVLHGLGMSFNFMVMFGMLLGLGMLIDGAIVVTEYADRKMAEGQDKRDAYLAAATRMFWPVVASTATTLAAFLPLFFWPGMSGKFMLYLPVTVFAVLVGSLLYALLFGPALGAIFGKIGTVDEQTLEQLRALERGQALTISGFTGTYARLLDTSLRYPLAILGSVLIVLYLIFSAYGSYGAGFIYFTQTDPTFGSVSVSARGNFSKEEIRDLVEEAEQQLISIVGIESLYTSTSVSGGGFFSRSAAPADQIGTIWINVENARRYGKTGEQLLEEARAAMASLAGIQSEIIAQEFGPSTGKAIQIQVGSKFREELTPAVERLRAQLDQMDGLRDIEDTRLLPGIEWEIVVDRARAALFGISVTEVGAAVQLVTNGIYLGEYRRDDAEEEVEIRLRYPKSDRNMDILDQLKVTTADGSVPLSNFVERKAKNKLDSIQRVDGDYVMQVRANVQPGVVADTKIKEIQQWINSAGFSNDIRIEFPGRAQEQAESFQFIGLAFLMALLLMFVLLVTQFNSFYQALLILTAVVMSTAGVLLGLLIFDQTFSVILTGIGIVALAGIVVNNNIVLIDTFNYLRRDHPDMSIRDVIINTGAQRLRPVLLTTITTILGLLPLASNVSIDLINRDIVYGSQVSAYWVKLASSIVYGLSFASVLTLVVTPIMLIIPSHLSALLPRLNLRGRNKIDDLLTRFQGAALKDR